MHDQASRLRNLVRRSLWTADSGAALPRVVAVAGGKPGSGCTTVAINVAAAIAQQGWRTVLIDADRQHPEIAARLNLTAQRTLSDTLAGNCDIHEAVLAAPAGLQVVAGSAVSEAAASFSSGSPSIQPLLAALAPHTD
jgi:MinD-like ATPase involved in chromosome partitioning or flagellar assembly